MAKWTSMGGPFPTTEGHLPTPVIPDRTMTPEAFCWLYAAGCVEAREQQALVTDEHLISQGYFNDLRKRVEEGRPPSDDVIGRVFTRPFQILGRNCTLEEMQHYWRVTHRDPAEKTPVFRVNVVPYQKKMYPRVDKEGMWWETYFYNPHIGNFEHRLLHNVHGYVLVPGTEVYIHGMVIAEVIA